MTYYLHAFVSGTVPAHGWFLVARAGYNGSVPADQINTAFPMPSPGNLFLVSNTTLLFGGPCPAVTTSIIDTVAQGIGFCPEGGANTPEPAANNSTIRKPGGACGNGTDTDNNAADFVIQSPSTPRNSASTPQP